MAAAVLATGGLCARVGWGHDSPEHVIEALTAQMQREGVSAPLLWRRAHEYRSLRRLDAATADLERAVQLEPDRHEYLVELARLELQSGRASAAIVRLNPLVTGGAGEQRLAALSIRGEAFESLGQLEAALADLTEASRERLDDVDLYLRRAGVQWRLGRLEERLAGLEIGISHTASAVLQIERIDTLIDLGRVQEALPLVEAELSDCRWQSTWLIRRAQIWRALGNRDASRADALAAAQEIDQRLHPQRPDPLLLADRALVRGLLGETAAASADLAEARSRHVDPAVARRVELALARHSS